MWHSKTEERISWNLMNCIGRQMNMNKKLQAIRKKEYINANNDLVINEAIITKPQ